MQQRSQQVMQSSPSLAEAAERLRAALLGETELARRGAIRDLAAAAEAKQAAFAVFAAACEAVTPGATRSDEDRAALHALVISADENMHILEAVRATLDGFAARLRAALEAAADPGVYGPKGREGYHVPATRVYASA
jgi:hypothetical protein